MFESVQQVLEELSKEDYIADKNIATVVFLARREPRVRPQPGEGPNVAIVAGPSRSGDCVGNSTKVTSPLSHPSVMAGTPFFLMSRRGSYWPIVHAANVSCSTDIL